SAIVILHCPRGVNGSARMSRNANVGAAGSNRRGGTIRYRNKRANPRLAQIICCVGGAGLGPVVDIKIAGAGLAAAAARAAGTSDTRTGGIEWTSAGRRSREEDD